MKENSDAKAERAKRAFKILGSVDVNLIPYKLYYFSFFFAHSSLLPYLPLYLKQLGLIARQAGFIVGVRYFLEIFGVLWGAVADKFKRRKLFVLIAIVAFTFKLMLFLAVQPHDQKCIEIQGNKTSIRPFAVSYSQEQDQEQDSTFSDANVRNIHQKNIDHHIYINGDSKFDLNWKSETTEDKRVETAKNYTEIGNSIYGRKDKVHRFISSDKPPSSRGNESIYQRQYKRLLNRDELNDIFVILVLMTVLGELFGGSAIYVLMDSSTCEYLRDDNEDGMSKFGQTMVYAQIANAVAALVVGALINSTKYSYCGETMKNYLIPFYFFVGFNCVAFLACATAKMVSNKSASSETKEVDQDSTGSGLASIIGNIRNVSILLATTIIGACLGVILNFNLWFFDDLGASTLLLGVAQGLYFCGNIVSSFCSTYLIRWCGHIPLIATPLVNFTVTLLCMSLIPNATAGAVIFALQGGMFGLCWPAVVSFFASQTITAGVLNTVQGRC